MTLSIAQMEPDVEPAAARSRLTLHVYSTLRQRIIRGRLAPNVHLLELEISRDLGVGRTPVREALQLLESEGLVVSKPGGRLRMFVAPLSASEEQQVADLLATLEGLAASKVAALPHDARRAAVERLRKIHTHFVRLGRMRSPDLERLFQTHRAFHAEIVARAGVPLLRAVHAPISARMERYEWLYGKALLPTLRVSVAEHAAIIRAIRRCQAAKAERAVRVNWINASARLATVL